MVVVYHPIRDFRKTESSRPPITERELCGRPFNAKESVAGTRHMWHAQLLPFCRSLWRLRVIEKLRLIGIIFFRNPIRGWSDDVWGRDARGFLLLDMANKPKIKAEHASTRP